MFSLPLSAGLALILVGLFIKSKWKHFAFWTALGLVGQAVSLQMIFAGHFTRFQQFRPLAELVNDYLFLLILFGFQAVLVGFGLSRHFSSIKTRIFETFTIWQILAISAFLILASSALAKDISLYLNSMFLSAVIQAVNLANIILIGLAIPDRAIDRLRQKLKNIFGSSDKSNGEKKIRLDKFALLAALWVFILAAILSYFVYRAHPHISDEAQYVYQANYMAAGQLTVTPPKVPEAFEVYMTSYREPRWFGIFPPGFPAVLAIGVKLGIPWLVNPFLGGLCILLAYIFFQEIYSLRFARIGVFLLCCSPWFVFMSMSFMSHILTLALALIASIFLLRAFKTQKILYTLGSGLAVGLLSLVRTLDALTIAVLLFIWALIKFPTWKTKISNAAALTLGTLATASIVLLYNQKITGDPKLMPLVFYYDNYMWKNASAIGFGPDRGFLMGEDAFHGHTPLESVINTAMNTFSVNIELFGWAIGSLFLAACFVIAGKPRKKDLWAIAAIAGFLFSFSLFWFNGGPDLGARYWFLIIIPLIALTVRGIEWLSQKLNEPEALNSKFSPRLMLVVVTLCLMSLVNYFPWRSFDKYHNYLEMRPDLPEMARKHNFGKSLVLIRGKFEQADYRSGWVYNPINFEGDVPLYAWDKNPEIRRKLLEAYPDRKIWIVEGPTLTKGAYRIIRGPVSADELLEELDRQPQ